MRHDLVDVLLRDFRANRARAEYLQALIPVAEAERDAMKDEIRGAAAYRVSGFDRAGMPRATGVGRPTEALALTDFDGHPDVAAADARVEKLRRELEEKRAAVRFVEAWMSGLNEKERFVLTEQLVEGRFWREIAALWPGRFGEALTLDALKKTRARAREKVYAIAGE